MSLFKSPLIVIDTETTGFESDPDAMPWDIGAVALDVEGEEVAHFEIMGRPPVLHERMDKALSIGGMTRDGLKSAPIVAKAMLAFHCWIAEQHSESKLTAFNIAFDRVMLLRAGFDARNRWGNCVMESVKPMMGEAGALPWFHKYNDWKMPKLSEAAAFFGVEQQQPAHRALADARTAALVCVALIRRMRSI